MYVAGVLHSVDQLGRTPVHLAAGRGHLAVLRLLMEAGARLDHADHEGATPLHAAATHGHEKLLVRRVLARALLRSSPSPHLCRTCLLHLEGVSQSGVAPTRARAGLGPCIVISRVSWAFKRG